MVKKVYEIGPENKKKFDWQKLFYVSKTAQVVQKIINNKKF